jgi:uncharacterized repeat protein (TIGR01451 family)
VPGSSVSRKRSIGVRLAISVLAVACLLAAAPAASAQTYVLRSLCSDVVTNTAFMGLTNNGSTDQPFSWFDTFSPQTGSGIAPAQTETVIEIAQASGSHTIVLDIAGERLTTRRIFIPCSTSLTVTKEVVGPAPPGARFTIDVTGDSGESEQLDLGAGESQTINVPATLQEGSAPIGSLPGGYRYVITESDPLGATVTVEPNIVVAAGISSASVVVTNTFAVVPPPGPVADLELTKSVTPRAARVGEVVTYTLEVTNLGPDPATDVVVEDIPATDEPNTVAEILSVSASNGGTCTPSRPVVCSLGDVAAGETVTIEIEVRPRITGLLRNVAQVSSPVSDPNESNNAAATGLLAGRIVQPPSGGPHCSPLYQICQLPPLGPAATPPLAPPAGGEDAPAVGHNRMPDLSGRLAASWDGARLEVVLRLRILKAKLVQPFDVELRGRDFTRTVRVAPHGQSRVTLKLSIPLSESPAGTRVVARIDPGKKVLEARERNNTAVARVQA